MKDLILNKLRTSVLSLLPAFLLASCSDALKPVSYTDVNVSLSRSLIKIPVTSSADEYSDLTFFLNAEISGDYHTKVSVPLSLDKLTQDDEVSLTVRQVPVNADINVKLTIEAEIKGNKDEPVSAEGRQALSAVLYSASKTLKVNPGINSIQLSLESRSQPYFTDTTKDQYFPSTTSGNGISLHASITVPFGFLTNTLAPSDLNVYLIESSSPNYDAQAAKEAFHAFKDSGTTDTVYSFNKVEDSNITTKKNYPESYDTVFQPFLTITPSAFNSKVFYTAWVVTYTDFNGKSGEVFSPATKFTCAENAGNFSFVINYTGQTHTDSDENEYILSDEFDPEAFSVMETWGDITTEGDFKNYSSENLDVYTYNKPVGDISIDFSYLDKTYTWTKTFKYLLPDIEEAALVLDSSSLYVSPEALSAGYYYLNNELTSGWTTQFIWIKDGTNLTENESVDASQSYIDITQDEYKTGIYSVLVKLYADSDMYQWAIYKDGSTPEYDAETKTVVPAVKNLGPVTITEESSSSGSSIITLGTYATNGQSQGDGSSPDAAVNIDEYLSSIKAGSTFYPKSYAVTMTGEAPAFDLSNISNYTSGGIVYYPDSDYLNTINIGLNRTTLGSYLTIALTKLPSETMLLCKIKNKGSWSISQLSLSSSWTLDDSTTDADGYTLIKAVPNY